MSCCRGVSGNVAVRRRWSGGPPVLGLSILLCGLLWSTQRVHGDFFELDDGRRIEGSVVREVGELISIKLVNGEIVTVDKKSVKKRERSVTPLDEYQDLLKKLKAADADAHFELAEWCSKKGLTEYQTKHLKEAIRLRPNHVKAREALGYELILGDWYLKDSPEAATKRKELDAPLTEQPKEITSEKSKSKRGAGADSSIPAPPPGTPRLYLQLDEMVDRAAPVPSIASSRLRHFVHGLPRPFLLEAPTEGERPDGIYLQIKLRVYFVRTHMYYQKVPITNIFKGEVSAEFVEVKAGQAMTVWTMNKITVPFSAGMATSKEDAFDYAYFDVVQALLSRLSTLEFFKERGAVAIPPPEA